MEFAVGTSVRCRFDGGEELFPGVVAAVRPGGTYDIQYDDGDFEGAVPAAFIDPAAHSITDSMDESRSSAFSSQSESVASASGGGDAGGTAPPQLLLPHARVRRTVATRASHTLSLSIILSAPFVPTPWMVSLTCPLPRCRILVRFRELVAQRGASHSLGSNSGIRGRGVSAVPLRRGRRALPRRRGCGTAGRYLRHTV